MHREPTTKECVCGMWCSFMASSPVLWRRVLCVREGWLVLWTGGKVLDGCRGWDQEGGRERERERRETEREQ